MSLPQANSEFRWPVTVTQAIAVPKQTVWDVISMPGNLELCHPFCAENIVQVWPGPDSVDQIRYLSGLVYERRFCRWLDGTGYDLEIRKSDNLVAAVSWRIVPVDDRNSVLTITVYPYLLQNVPLLVRWLPHFFRLRPMLRKYLHSVTNGFEWYVTRGEPVPRDQFGKHDWFSARDLAAA